LYQPMKKQKIAFTEDKFLLSTNNYEDDDCPVCQLMRKVENEHREPTEKEVDDAIELAISMEMNREDKNVRLNSWKKTQ
jgi:hypothetical protein